MGTGTPTVTVSGLSVANAVFKKLGKEPFVYKKDMKNYVRYLEKPVTKDMLYGSYRQEEKNIMHKALSCRMCEHPTCTRPTTLDVRGIMRRVAVGNFKGAYKTWLKTPVDNNLLDKFEANCIIVHEKGNPVPIRQVLDFLKEAIHEKDI